MKNKLNIFSNNKINNFLNTFLSDYEIVFLKLEDVEKNLQEIQKNIIFLNNSKDAELIDFNNISNNFLIISSLKKNFSSKNNLLKILNTPGSINYIKNTIEHFIQNIKIQFHDLLIENEKLTNLNNSNFCYLTKVELEILSYLIREEQANKNLIKKNILKIKSSLETNSLESHLTRIRKKLNKIDTIVKIYSRNEKLLITV